MNYQHEKRSSDHLKKAQKKVLVLEGELKRRDKELTATVEEKKEKDEEIFGLQQGSSRGRVLTHLRPQLE